MVPKHDLCSRGSYPVLEIDTQKFPEWVPLNAYTRMTRGVDDSTGNGLLDIGPERKDESHQGGQQKVNAPRHFGRPSSQVQYAQHLYVLED